MCPAGVLINFVKCFDWLQKEDYSVEPWEFVQKWTYWNRTWYTLSRLGQVRYDTAAIWGRVGTTNFHFCFVFCFVCVCVFMCVFLNILLLASEVWLLNVPCPLGLKCGKCPFFIIALWAGPNKYTTLKDRSFCLKKIQMVHIFFYFIFF